MQVNNSFSNQNLNYLNDSQKNVSDTLSKIAATRELSGQDGAQYVLSSSLTTEISGLSQNIQNKNESIAMYQIADGVLSGLSDSTNRLNELSVAYENGALNDTQKEALANEFSALQSSMQDMVDTASYNGSSLMSGSLEVSGISDMSIESQESIATFSDTLNTLNSTVGASINSSASSISNSLSTLTNLTSANAEVSEKPMDEKINDLKQNEIKIQSSLIVQSHQKELDQQRIGALLL